MDASPARPQDFLELVERSRRGRLKIYLGFAAGVGKTYRMLQEAQALKKRGTDVVLGIIETHGRRETEDLMAGLEQVPLRRIEYRGVVIQEMDTDAVIARRPAIALVDEVAHTNAPGLKHRRRYEDVLDLLTAGINVICAFNIQHLESLNDVVLRNTGVKVRETVPDTFLKEGDQIVTLDLTVEDLLDRLAAGQIYAADKIPLAQKNFFRSENLSALRELALREVAESLERTSAPRELGTSPAPKHQEVTQRVMVCLTSNPPRAQELLRRGSRMAGRFNTGWLVVYVQTPGEAPGRIESEAQRHLLANLALAKELGAEVVRLESSHPAAALLACARSHDVAHIVIGRSRSSWWRRLLGLSVMDRLVRDATDMDLHILSPPRAGEDV
jgi:two-component system sensor histidine kinase KdpD